MVPSANSAPLQSRNVLAMRITAPGPRFQIFTILLFSQTDGPICRLESINDTEQVDSHSGGGRPVDPGVSIRPAGHHHVDCRPGTDSNGRDRAGSSCYLSAGVDRTLCHLVAG